MLRHTSGRHDHHETPAADLSFGTTVALLAG
jgi:hypothetical protein